MCFYLLLLETELAQDQWVLNPPICRDIGNDGFGQAGPVLLFDLWVVLPVMIPGILPGIPVDEGDVQFVELGTSGSREIRIEFVKILADEPGPAGTVVVSILPQMLNQKRLGWFVCKHDL